MGELVELLVEDERWAEMELAGLAERAVRAGIEARGLSPEGYVVSLLACDDARMAALNAKYRGKAGPTNVLSWPAHVLAPAAPGEAPRRPPPALPGRPEPLGDIAIGWERVTAEARAAGLDPAHHLQHLLVHATLHLLGYDHETEADAALMEGLESRTLARMGLHNPYLYPGSLEESQPRQEK
ncbi:MAG TPA: rRNA maturation RNase YbeY [Paracoccaceae bacterium]|nr:rRNA maturation RNase YbeY [Paracoccaceae bacterium]